MTDTEKKAIFAEFLERYGLANEIIMAIEEMSELNKELAKWLRYDFQNGETVYKKEEAEEHIIEELADVYNTIDQLREVFGPKKIDETRVAKLRRGKQRMEEAKRKI